jgi:O-antigen ligase
MIAFRRRDPILWIAIVAQTAGIFLTFSRGAILAVIVGVGISLLVLGMRRNLMVFSGLALGIGAVLFITSRERLLDLGGSGSEPTRFAIWRSSLEMLADHAVFGIGPDQFLYQYGPRYIEPSAWDERYTSHPHNIVLDVWLRLGAAGIGAFAALIVGVWKLGRRSCTRIRNDAISCGAIAALTGAMAHGLLDNGFFLPDLAGMTWIAIAMLVTFGPASSPVAASEVGPNEG